MKIKPWRLSKQLENQLDFMTENPFVFCGYKVSHVIGQNTHSRNIFSVHGFLSLSVKQELKTFISNYFITFYTCHYTVLLSPDVDILSNLNYFPVPRVREFDQKITKKFKCHTLTRTLPPPLRLNIDTCISTVFLFASPIGRNLR